MHFAESDYNIISCKLFVITVLLTKSKVLPDVYLKNTINELGLAVGQV